jgi:septal ring-binding cell division protein DamX
VSARDRGCAIVEFVFVAVVVMVPLIYLITAVAAVQRSQLAVSQAAREAGRAFATSDSAADTQSRVEAAVRLALESQGLPDDVSVRVVAADDSCSGQSITPALVAGAVFRICVLRHVDIPAVPNVIAGRGITSTGEYVVHVDDFRTVAP